MRKYYIQPTEEYLFEIVDFCHSCTKFFHLLGYYVAWGDLLKSHILGLPVCPIFKGQDVQDMLDILTLEKGTNR
jgi:hypothetical protein